MSVGGQQSQGPQAPSGGMFGQQPQQPQQPQPPQQPQLAVMPRESEYAPNKRIGPNGQQQFESGGQWWDNQQVSLDPMENPNTRSFGNPQQPQPGTMDIPPPGRLQSIREFEPQISPGEFQASPQPPSYMDGVPPGGSDPRLSPRNGYFQNMQQPPAWSNPYMARLPQPPQGMFNLGQAVNRMPPQGMFNAQQRYQQSPYQMFGQQQQMGQAAMQALRNPYAGQQMTGRAAPLPQGVSNLVDDEINFWNKSGQQQNFGPPGQAVDPVYRNGPQMPRMPDYMRGQQQNQMQMMQQMMNQRQAQMPQPMQPQQMADIQQAYQKLQPQQQQQAPITANDILAMSAGNRAKDMQYDFNGDGKITSADALLFSKRQAAPQQQAAPKPGGLQDLYGGMGGGGGYR